MIFEDTDWKIADPIAFDVFKDMFLNTLDLIRDPSFLAPEMEDQVDLIFAYYDDGIEHAELIYEMRNAYFANTVKRRFWLHFYKCNFEELIRHNKSEIYDPHILPVSIEKDLVEMEIEIDNLRLDRNLADGRTTLKLSMEEFLKDPAQVATLSLNRRVEIIDENGKVAASASRGGNTHNEYALFGWDDGFSIAHASMLHDEKFNNIRPGLFLLESECFENYEQAASYFSVIRDTKYRSEE